MFLSAPFINSFLTILEFPYIVAKCNGVTNVSVSYKFIFAFHEIKKFTALNAPEYAAQCNGDEPLLSTQLIYKPFFK
jgi:hypothetical protein